jgi:hypothetical protein
MVPGEMVQDCFICSKHRNAQQLPGGTIYEDELVYVGHIGSNEKTVYLGYLVIDLKRHVPGLGDMTLEESRAIGETLNPGEHSFERDAACGACVCLCSRRCRAACSYSCYPQISEHSGAILGADENR